MLAFDSSYKLNIYPITFLSKEFYMLPFVVLIASYAVLSALFISNVE
jgi:hypothetical protein